MRKSKYLIINSFYFDFNNDLTYIINVGKLFKNQTVLDLERFNDLKIIKFNVFSENQIKHLRLPKNIEIIGDWAFANNKIEILDLSNCIKLKNTGDTAFYKNQIKRLKLHTNIELIDCNSFLKNQIESLDLSNYTKLKHIVFNAFFKNPLNEIKILGNINIDYYDYSEYKEDLWTKFAKYYNENNKKEGDYKLENNKWQWYPL
jgi:hypothetical protein